jgi:hypothetical protein
MKYFTLLVAGLLLPLSQALAGSWGISGHIGRAMGDTDNSDLNNQINSQGLNATASSSQHNRTAWQLLLSYRYTPAWSVELGYVDLGDVSTNLSGNTANIDAFLTSVSDIHSRTAYGWQLSASYHYPIDATANVVVRAGVLDWRSKYRLQTNTASHTVSEDDVSGMYSLGIDKDLGQNKTLNVNYSRYDIDGETIPVLAVGLTYTFN